LDSNLKQAAEKTKALAPNAVYVSELEVPQALKNEEETRQKIVQWCQSLKSSA
jgi:hypothetical protein